MKKLFPFLIFFFLLQSCFSYKSVNYIDINNEKKQKFEVSKLDKTEVKGRLISINENKIILEHKGQNQTIPKDEIYDLKVRKFSVLKTLTGVGSSYVFLGIGALAILSLSGFP
jgi:hypothetical protein